jgi:hypothetical protein
MRPRREADSPTAQDANCIAHIRQRQIAGHDNPDRSAGQIARGRSAMEISDCVRSLHETDRDVAGIDASEPFTFHQHVAFSRDADAVLLSRCPVGARTSDGWRAIQRIASSHGESGSCSNNARSGRRTSIMHAAPD